MKASLSSFVPWVFLAFFLVGTIIFSSCICVSLSSSLHVLEYSSPLTPLWCGLCLMWLSAPFFVWWMFLRARFSRWGHWFAIVICAIFAICGFINMIAFACSPNEAAACVLSILWIMLGVFGCVTSFLWIRESKVEFVSLRQQKPDQHESEHESGRIENGNHRDSVSVAAVSVHDSNNDDDNNNNNNNNNNKNRNNPKRTLRACCLACCTGRNWLLGFGMFLLVFLGVFGIGFTIQAILAAAEYNQYPPPGKIHTVSVEGYSFRIHMHCIGPKSGANIGNSRNATILFEHGGGSNSVSGMGLQTIWANAGIRTCVYDRLGYGWTPSLFQRANQNPTSAVILVALLRQAGETGPFVCVGHSAGAAACMEFALASSNNTEIYVVGIAILDGYPDLIRAGSFRPGSTLSIPTSAITQQLQGFAVMVGPTGLARSQLGSVDSSSFAIPSREGAYKALYSQSRFWLAQYFDVEGDISSGKEGYLFERIPGGFRDSQNLLHYGNSFSFRVLHIPAFSTVNTTCFEGSSDWCCSSYGMNSDICKNKREDAVIYLAQANLYASTIGTSGKVIVGPQGSEHSFVYTNPYTEWLASTISHEFFK